jgi:hypothetical protein
MIVIPMAGLSRRFVEAGYGLPKYMLPLSHGTVFSHAVDSFRKYFGVLEFLFVARDVLDTGPFIGNECHKLGMPEPKIEFLAHPTAGQAESVELGLLRCGVSDDEPITIFNIDTFRPGFGFPSGADWISSDGYLEVFRGAGDNWSRVRPATGPEPLVIETAEKKPISELCCTGLYHFGRASDFHFALAHERRAPSSGELYVAPLYNHLINAGRRIHYQIIDVADVIFCGVPAEYELLCGRKDVARKGDNE